MEKSASQLSLVTLSSFTEPEFAIEVFEADLITAPISILTKTPLDQQIRRTDQSTPAPANTRNVSSNSRPVVSTSDADIDIAFNAIFQNDAPNVDKNNFKHGYILFTFNLNVGKEIISEHNDDKRICSRVVKDVFHLMDIIKPYKRHGLYKEFTQRFSDSLFVIDEDDKKLVTEAFEILAEIVKRIVLFLPEYQTEIRNLKKQGFKILGHARKSEGAEDHRTRIRLLNPMCRRLKERSLVDHVFVSYNSQANDPLAERDMKQKDELLTQLSAEGNTQDMLAYITNTEKICLVALDHAGLSTDCNDLYGFLTQHSNLEKVMIDTMPTESVIHVYERNRLLNDPEMLKKFECRKKPHQRSNWEMKVKYDRNWVWERVKRKISSPHVLLPVLQSLFLSFGPLKCSKSGRVLFDKVSWSQALSVLKTVQLVHVSNPPGVQLYYKKGKKDKHGLTLYRCVVRGTNSLEGGVHQNLIRKFGFFGAGPELASAMLVEYRLRHNFNVGTFNRFGFEYKGHYDPWLTKHIDYLRLSLNLNANGNQPKHVAIEANALKFCGSKEVFGICPLPDEEMQSLCIEKATVDSPLQDKEAYCINNDLTIP
ncbi:unnamed protein product [Mucor hiemalis]